MSYRKTRKTIEVGNQLLNSIKEIPLLEPHNNHQHSKFLINYLHLVKKFCRNTQKPKKINIDFSELYQELKDHNWLSSKEDYTMMLMGSDYTSEQLLSAVRFCFAESFGIQMEIHYPSLLNLPESQGRAYLRKYILASFNMMDYNFKTGLLLKFA